MRQAAFHAFMREVDGVVALTEWTRAILLRNGVPRSKIIVSPHGLPSVPDGQEPLLDAAERPLRIAFLGRADRVKGPDTLIKAVRAAPDLSIVLDLYGVTQSAADEKYWATLTTLAAQDARINFRPPVPHDQVVRLLRTYHLLAVPSRWVETGPLVVLEAFAAGIPVIGSGLGGIADRVHHRSNGLLVDCEDLQGWTAAFRECAEDRSLLAKLRQAVTCPRTMDQVATEMAGLYAQYRHCAGSEKPVILKAN
jgi:glycosyltransferase involved in cell wall biosynthesis